jgi:hypothetical protein
VDLEVVLEDQIVVPHKLVVLVHLDKDLLEEQLLLHQLLQVLVVVAVVEQEQQHNQVILEVLEVLDFYLQYLERQKDMLVVEVVVDQLVVLEVLVVVQMVKVVLQQ